MPGTEVKETAPVTTGSKILTSPDVKESITFKGFKLNLNITATTSKEVVMKAVNDLCEAISANDALGERMRLTLGRLLSIVQERQLFRPEYKRFEEYRMAMAQKYRMSRATISAALGIAKALPSVDVARASNVPLTNLTLLAKAARIARDTKQIPIGEEKISDLLTLAESNSLKQFRAKLESEQLIPKRKDVDKVQIVIKCTERMLEAWNEYVGDKDPAEVLAKLIGYEPAKLDKLKTRRRG